MKSNYYKFTITINQSVESTKIGGFVIFWYNEQFEHFVVINNPTKFLGYLWYEGSILPGMNPRDFDDLYQHGLELITDHKQIKILNKKRLLMEL